MLLAHLSVASLHVPQRHLWVDGVAARHAENLQVRVVAVAFVHLRGNEGGVSQRSAPLAPFPGSTGLAENRHEMVRSGRSPPHPAARAAAWPWR